MPYDERTIEELSESAEITPMGIQLEVNAEIFQTIHNLLCTLKGEKAIQPADEARLYKLWRMTIHEMSLIELRKGHGLAMSAQVGMLREAYAIETKYVQDQIFRPVTSAKLTRQVIERKAGSILLKWMIFLKRRSGLLSLKERRATKNIPLPLSSQASPDQEKPACHPWSLKTMTAISSSP